MLKKLVLGFCLLCLILGVAAPAEANQSTFNQDLKKAGYTFLANGNIEVIKNKNGDNYKNYEEIMKLCKQQGGDAFGVYDVDGSYEFVGCSFK
ncbi:MAG: hypothetical protein F6K54_20210 [Okeania sp. SIO3B5]|uniref:hypothetical protein n=1 Tax=Okeania sp. SIO3B5 TaxID=2607811 RepID=UPI0013FE5973|nr:hypothetical protein [Okeania sp. SIO3B5]NEO55195.1 hypothetical protein [Okeania sp. SIO3B5]